MDGYLSAFTWLNFIRVCVSDQLILCLLNSVNLRQIILSTVTVIVCIVPVFLYILRCINTVLKISCLQINLRYTEPATSPVFVTLTVTS